jgi:hypothetical protein
MVALFLRTELPSARCRADLKRLLHGAGLPERIIEDPDLNDLTENEARRQLLIAHRGDWRAGTGMFQGFLSDVRWTWMAITPAELSRVRYIDYDYWVELSGGTRLASDGAPLIRAGLVPFRIPSDWALGIARALAAGARFRPLILVTAGDDAGTVVLKVTPD